ncbi:flagellar biosynthesis protein FliS [Staphylococcus aureus]|uniref:flagellar biosynthesis protein FliS n=1 Tax=Staphylococcus aureus TaxID=1280 RepID=UPI0012459721|nr:flagellar biosynthesis protein FliS [Staphylococcus aureus]
MPKNPFKRKRDGKGKSPTTKKIKVKDTPKTKYRIIGGLLGDKDKRTRSAIWWVVIRLLCGAGLVLGIIWFVQGKSAMNYEIKNNTTPIGTQLEFSKNEAKVNIKDVWTDKKRDVLVVKLGYTNGARKMLPTDGVNYNLTLLTNNGKTPKLSGSYGMLGTEGDGYLFLKGDIDKEAYQLVIANQLQLSSGSPDSDTNTKGSEISGDSIEKELSKASFEEADDKGVLFNKFTGKDSEPKFDNVNFRVNGFSKSTNVYDGSFLKQDGSIDYGKVVSKTSVDKAINRIDEKIKKSEDKLKTYEVSKEEYEKRVKKNKKDKDAKKSVEDVKKSIENEEEAIKELKESKRVYEESDFDKSDFGEMQEKMKFMELD